jgi:hypothetical protein
MTSDSGPPEIREAALRAFSLNDRRQPIAALVEDSETPEGGAVAAGGRLWRFEGEGLIFELELSPTVDGWRASTRVLGQPSFETTVYRSERPSASFTAHNGRSALGVLGPGPLSVTYRLADGREIQSMWTTVPRLPSEDDAVPD